MNKRKIIKFLLLAILVCPLIVSNSLGKSESENFKIFTDVLDESGGRTESANFLLRIGSGGQPVSGGKSQGSSFYISQGYGNTAAFMHGDDNADGDLSVSDVIYEINFLFKGGPKPIPPEVGDVNCDNDHSVSDVIYKINFLFKGGPKPCNL